VWGHAKMARVRGSLMWLRRLTLMGALLSLLAASARADEPKRVLLLHSFGPNFEPWNAISARLREELFKQSPYPIDLYEAALQGERLEPSQGDRPLLNYLRDLFAQQDLALVIAMGAPAARFLLRNRSQLFASVPLLISGADQRTLPDIPFPANVAAVASRLDQAAPIDNILAVLPQTTTVAVITGASRMDRFWTEEYRRAFQHLAVRVRFYWLQDLSAEDMFKVVAALPPHSAIYYAHVHVDARGIPQEEDRIFARLHDAANAPMFSYIDNNFGRGLVGGPMLSTRQLAQESAVAAVRLLKGEVASTITTPVLGLSTPIYDWRELKRWNIGESDLPSGSVVQFRQPSTWEQYRWQILFIVAAMLLQAALISWLTYEHRRRSLAEVRSRNAMAELAHMNRLETAGQLSASIAHEINQPVTGIILKASAALRWLTVEKPDVDKLRAALADIVGAGERAGDIITGVRAMFKKGTSAKATINLNNLINTVLALLHLDLQKDGVRVDTRLDQQLPVVDGDAVQLQQVILNLIVNAEEAMRGAEPRILKVRTNRSTAGTVRVSIEDSGPGISEADRARIFDPLFTTKAGGMGMGLSICRSIVENHGGKIWVEAATACGAVFQFELPARRVHIEPQNQAT